ncbi:MAG: 30S ribosomal protein S6 [Planctomycetota bacterium]
MSDDATAVAGQESDTVKKEPEEFKPQLPSLDPEIEKTTRLYELMLMFDPAEASRTWDKLVEWVNDLIGKRLGQHVLRVDKWADSRKLAYEIKGLKRATYMLVWFRAEPKTTRELEQQIRLEERILRHLLLVHDSEPPGVGQTAEDFDAAAPPPPERY